MNNTPSEQERIFREWMRRQMNENCVRRYTDNAIIAYCYALRTACHKLVPPVAGNLFGICDAQTFNEIYPKITSSKDYNQVNRENGNGTFGVALRLYQTFLNDGGQSIDVDVAGDSFTPHQNVSSGYNENRGEDFHYTEVPMKPLQIIFYGAPGTGKSYKVSKILEAEYPDEEKRNFHTKRMIFHPSYTYQDFVGSIKPLVSLDHPLDYVYSAGPFSSLLKEAFHYPAEKFFLIIEEINRGNSPAIFGDLFQLLDRQDNGKSRYPVLNVDVSAFFARDPSLKKLFNDGKIWLPANFNILATMNTADENIFVLDSAFKRRFTLDYVRIDFEEMPEVWKGEYETFQGTKPLMEVFTGTMLEPYARRLEMKGLLKRNWPTFAKLTNHLIDSVNSEVIASKKPDNARIAENKKLGPYFVSQEELQDIEKFLNKVVFYLKQDVFTYSDHFMLSSYEEIYVKYMDFGGDVFELLT